MKRVIMVRKHLRLGRLVRGHRRRVLAHFREKSPQEEQEAFWNEMRKKRIAEEADSKEREAARKWRTLLPSNKLHMVFFDTTVEDFDEHAEFAEEGYARAEANAAVNQALAEAEKKGKKLTSEEAVNIWNKAHDGFFSGGAL